MNDYRRGVTACSDALQQILVDLNSDAVLINTMTNVPAMLAAVALDIPSLLWVHGVIDSLLLPGRPSEFAAPHDELLLHSATRVIALSNYTSDFCARVMQRSRLDVIHNWTPVDPQFAAPPDKYRSRRFACLNTFDPHKGYATLLKAAALLKARKIVFELHLYGDGEVRGEMERRAAALGLQDCVRFQGRTTNVQEVYDRSLGVVNPAQVEPFGMTLIEAMARKTPVVATRSGGPADIVVDGQSGYLVDRGDAAAIADRMQALLESPDVGPTPGRRGLPAGLRALQRRGRPGRLPAGDRGSGSRLPGLRSGREDPRRRSIASGWSRRLPGPARVDARLRSRPQVPVQTAARLARGGIRRTKASGKTRPGGARNRSRGAARCEPMPRWSRTCSPDRSAPRRPWILPAAPRKFHPLRRKIRYRLVPDQGNWAGLDVLVCRNPLLAAGRLRLCVRSASGQLLREAVSPLGDMGEKGWLGFRFSPIANAAGMPFDVEIVAEKLVPDSHHRNLRKRHP